MASCRSTTDWKMPRLRGWRVSLAKKPSTAEPGRRARREVERPARVTRQPSADTRMFESVEACAFLKYQHDQAFGSQFGDAIGPRSESEYCERSVATPFAGPTCRHFSYRKALG